MTDKLSPAAHRRALRLQLRRIHRKIAATEAEIAAVGGSRENGLFGNPSLRVLGDRLDHLRTVVRDIEAELLSLREKA